MSGKEHVALRPRVFLAMIAQALSSNDVVTHSATTFRERSCGFDVCAFCTSLSILL